MANEKNMVNLEKEVQCPLCMEVFQEPKRLPCEHVFCVHCLEKLLLRSTDGALTCPVCRNHIPLQGKDPKQFPTSLVMVRLIDVYKESIKEQCTPKSSVQTSIGCSLHASQSLELYCENCRKTVCRDCVIKSCSKNNHEYGYVSDMSKKYLEQINQAVLPVLQFQESIKTAQVTAASNEAIIQDKMAEHTRRIRETFDELTGILQRERASLLLEVENCFSESLARNADYKSKLLDIMDELDTFVQSARGLSMDDPISKIFEEVTKKSCQEKLLITKFQGLSLQPVQPPQMDLEILQPDDLARLCQKNFVFQAGDVYRSHLDRHALHKLLEMELNKLQQINIHAYSIRRFSRMKSKLVSSLDGSSQSVCVTEVSPDTFQLSFTPKKRGKNKLQIKCSDSHLCGSPISVYVNIHPQQLSVLEKTVQLPLCANSVKCHGGKVYVMENGKSVTSIHYSSTNMVIDKMILIETSGDLLLHKDHFYFTDSDNNTITKTDINGVVHRTIGGRGTRQGYFNVPNGIRVSSKEHIYVCDSKNHRIQVFNMDLKFLRSFGKEGQNPGEFFYPDDLDFDHEGNIYVVEQENNRVQVLTEEGQHLRFIGEPTSQFSGLKSPVSPAICKDYIYVTDIHRIAVFTLLGEFVATFGEDKLTEPVSIAIDEDGYIFVTDSQHNLLRF